MPADTRAANATELQLQTQEAPMVLFASDLRQVEIPES